MPDDLKLYEVNYYVDCEYYEHLKNDHVQRRYPFLSYAAGNTEEEAKKLFEPKLRTAEEIVRRRHGLWGDKLEAQIYCIKEVKVSGHKIKLEKIIENAKKND